MTEWLENFTTWAQLHNELALGVVFLVSFIDCLFVVGLFLVSAVFLFAAGALVALGALEFWPVILTTAGGAILGDTLSYLIGRHYGVALFGTGFFVRRPALVEQGRAFFNRHGGKGLIIAHNIGVLRPLLPTMAGAYGLPPLRFVLAIGPAALSWALIYTVPGVLFGASMGLAAEVTRRLAILIIGLGFTLWLTPWLTWLLARWAQGHAQSWLRGMLRLSRRHRILGKLGPALADPEQPETPALALIAAALFAIAAALLLLIWGLHAPAPPPDMDLSVYQTLRSLENPWATSLSVYFSLLGEWPVYLPYALSVLLLLAWQRRRRAAAHWLAALLFGSAITLGLSLIPSISNPLEYAGLVSDAHFPRDLVMAAVIYGLTPVLLMSHRSRHPHTSPYALMLVLLVFIVLARLYLGTVWLSVGLVAALIGLLWVAALALGYRLHAPDYIPLRSFAPALLVFALAAFWHQQTHFDRRQLEHTPVTVSKPLSAERWWTQDWQLLRARRQDMAGHDKQYLNLQWGGSIEDIHAALLASGWSETAPLSFSGGLGWLSESTPIGDLPLLPRYHAGRPEVLRLRREIDDGHQYLLRLWPSGYTLGETLPLWTGTLVQQEALTLFRVFRYPTNENIYSAALGALDLPLSGFETQRVQRVGTRYVTKLLRPLPDTETPAQASIPP